MSSTGDVERSAGLGTSSEKNCQFDIHDEAMPEQNFSELLYQATVGAEKLCPVWDGHEIRIRALQHMTTLHLQRKLAKLVKEMVKSQKATDDQMDDLHKALKDYIESLRDLKFTLETPSSDARVADFLQKRLYIAQKRSSDRAILESVGLLAPSNDARLHVSDYTGQKGHNHREDKKKAFFLNLLERLKMALFGGLTLIVPMLIMTLHRTLLTTLLTTSLFVLAVAVVLALTMVDAEPKDILGATAAYAAILVVFVGTSSPA